MKFKYAIIDGNTAKIYDEWQGMVEDVEEWYDSYFSGEEVSEKWDDMPTFSVMGEHGDVDDLNFDLSDYAERLAEYWGHEASGHLTPAMVAEYLVYVDEAYPEKLYRLKRDTGIGNEYFDMVFLCRSAALNAFGRKVEIIEDDGYEIEGRKCIVDGMVYDLCKASGKEGWFKGWLLGQSIGWMQNPEEGM